MLRLLLCFHLLLLEGSCAAEASMCTICWWERAAEVSKSFSFSLYSAAKASALATRDTNSVIRARLYPLTLLRSPVSLFPALQAVSHPPAQMPLSLFLFSKAHFYNFWVRVISAQIPLFESNERGGWVKRRGGQQNKRGGWVKRKAKSTMIALKIRAMMVAVLITMVAMVVVLISTPPISIPCHFYNPCSNNKYNNFIKNLLFFLSMSTTTTTTLFPIIRI